MEKQIIPIIIFAFNRPDALRKLIESIRTNPGYESYPIRVYMDGARNSADSDKIKEVVDIALTITSDIRKSVTNKGLAKSIIAGVTESINEYGKVIVLEDDLILMPGFLSYISKALELYEPDSRVFSICGYGLKIKRPNGYNEDVYLSNRSSSWGWATWKDRWDSVDWAVSDWTELARSKRRQRAFNEGGSDMYGMLKAYMEGRNSSWAIRFCYSQHCQRRFSVHPFLSLVSNEGYGIDATNCNQKYSRFKVDLNTTGEPLSLPTHINGPDSRIIAQLRRYHSLPIRIYSRLRKILNI